MTGSAGRRSPALLRGWTGDLRAGAMAFHALRAALAAGGREVSLDWLIACSGEAFAVAWSERLSACDLQAARPLATTAAAAHLAGVGFETAWADAPDAALAALRRHTARGGLALAPCFDDRRVGVAAAVDADGRVLAVGPDRLAPAWVDLRGGWRGSFPGGALARPNVYALLHEPTAAERRAADLRPAAAAMLRGAAGRGVVFGPPAVRAAARVLGRAGALRDADMLARLLCLAEQAEFGFGCAERWLSQPARAAELPNAAELARRARMVRAAAGELAERLWDRRGQASAAALARAVPGRKSMVFALPPPLADADVPGPVLRLPRGRAVVVETRSRRAAAVRLAEVTANAVAGFAAAVDRAGVDGADVGG